MKAWFVFKDGQLVGNPLGYKTEKLAKRYIHDSDDRSDQWFEYSMVTYGKYHGVEDIPEDLKASGIFYYESDPVVFFGFDKPKGWYVSYPVWEKNVWKPYVRSITRCGRGITG